MHEKQGCTRIVLATTSISKFIDILFDLPFCGRVGFSRSNDGEFGFNKNKFLTLMEKSGSLLKYIPIDILLLVFVKVSSGSGAFQICEYVVEVGRLLEKVEG